MKKRNKINIKKSKVGTFTKAAKKAGMSVQDFAKKVLANKHNYSSAMVKKANFAANAAKWKKQIGGDLFTEDSNKVNYIPSIHTLINDPNWKKNYITNMVNKYNTSELKNVKPSKINLKLKPKEKRSSKFKTKFNLNTSENKVDHPLWGKYKKVSRPSGFTTSFSYDPNDALSITGKIDSNLKNKEINPSIQLKDKYKNILDIGYNTDFDNSNLNLGLNNEYINAKFNTDFKGDNRLALKGKYKKLFGADFDTDFKKSYNVGVKAGPFSGKFSDTDNIKNLELSLKHKNIGLKFDTDLQNRQRFNVSGEKKLGPVRVKGDYNINRDKDKLYHNLGIEGDIKFSPKFSLSPSLVSDITNQKNKLGLSAKISPNKNIILTPKISWSPDQYSVGTGINWKPNKMLNIGADVNYGNEGFGGNVSLKAALNNAKKELPKAQKGKIVKSVFKQYPGLYNVASPKDYKAIKAKGKHLEHLEGTDRGLEYFPPGDTWYPYQDSEDIKLSIPGNKNKHRILYNPNLQNPDEALKLDIISHSYNTPQTEAFKADLDSKLRERYGDSMVDSNGGVDGYIRGYLSNSEEYAPYKKELEFLPKDYFKPFMEGLENKQKGGLVKYQDGKYIPLDYSIFKPINYSNSESTRIEKPIQMTLAEKDNLRKLEEEKKLKEIGRVAKLNREDKFRESVGQSKTPLNTFMAGLQGPGMVYSVGLQGIKRLTGSDGGADWSKVQPDFYGIRNNPAYEGQDYSLSKAISDKWAKDNPGLAGLIDIGVPLVGGAGLNKTVKLVDNTLDFANSAKGGLGAMPGTFTKYSNNPKNVITVNSLNKNLSDFSKETIKEVKPNANRFENIIYTNPILQGNARNLVEQGKINEIYDSFKEGANTIDEFKKNYLKDLISDEGIKRLINQEADYLRSIGIPESEIAKRAETAAFARINEIKDIKNLNRKFSQGKSELSSIIDNLSNFNNAYYRSANKQEILDDVLSDDLVNNTGGISLKKNKRIGEKSYPGSTALGTTYSKNIPTVAHEIAGHGLQANRKLPLDDRLRKLDVDPNTLNEYELAAYNYYKKGSKGKEPSAFLHGLREAMLQAGLIKSRYEYISPKKIKMAKTYFDRRPSGVVNDNDFSFHSNTRILDFAKPTESNFKLLAEEINKLPLTIPAIGTAGLLNQQQYKKGGQVKKDLKGTYTSSAQRLMDDNDLDPSYITASNKNGRIYKRDVSKALKSLNNYGAGFPNALDYKKVGVLPKNRIKYSKNTLIGPVGMPPYKWKNYKTPIFNHGGQIGNTIPCKGSKVSMKILDENDVLHPADSDNLSYRDKPVGMSLSISKTIKSPTQIIQYDDGGNIARTEDEFKEGLNAGKNVFPFGQKGLKKMTSTPPSGDMEVPINVKGFTDGQQTDEQVMLPGEDVNVDGDTIVETPDLSSMDLNKAFDYANSKKFPIFMWKGNEYKLKRHLKKKQRGGLFSSKVTDHVKLNPGFSPDVK
jgi:hypothetical protein